MNIPVPKNRLVQLTLIAAVLTSVTAVGLAMPNLFHSTPASDNPQLDNTAPRPNTNFTPQVQQTQQNSHEEENEEEYKEEYE